MLSQRSSIGAHIQEGPIWLEEPQVAHSEGLERAFEPRGPNPIKHCLWEAFKGGCAVPVDGSCDIPRQSAKDEDHLWVASLGGDLQQEWLSAFLTTSIVGPTAQSTSGTSGTREVSKSVRAVGTGLLRTWSHIWPVYNDSQGRVLWHYPG